jgi:hypothetical protein
MKEAPGSSETSVLTRATRRNNLENTILHSHLRENLKSYMDLFPFSGEGRETPTRWDLLEIANRSRVVQWFRLGVSE